MPVDTSNDLCSHSINYAIENTKFFIYNDLEVTYNNNHTKFIIISWIPECTMVIDNFPEDIGAPTIVFKGYLQSKISYIKVYDYNGTDTCYIECYYEGKSIYFEKSEKNNDYSIYHVLGMPL